ncbi:Tn3 family transposase [Spartinivicinus poritis]|uniref:Tn3 family transposase n=1 Tax=Spartinivicinus poritis TaxID=2994640 RepID=A0ABT5UHH6_9GAMM|nr:Tn3 family transposase [Spartinivicinus sp. A2-2]MDE1465851.1 Tn3 family transposase [Spartinivicinus sp. A2-2]
MSAEHETAYPRFKSNLTDTELSEIYTPTDNELAFARRHSGNQAERLALLLQLKVVQRLGYFTQLTEIPTTIRSHIAQHAHIKGVSKTQLRNLDRAGTRHRLRHLVRSRLKIKPFEDGGTEVVAESTAIAAQTMQELVDIINVAIEELIRQRFELPGFTKLLRTARSARAYANTQIYQAITSQLSTDIKNALDQLLVVDPDASESGWQRLKCEPKKPTNKQVRAYLNHLTWLKQWVEKLPDMSFIAAAKWRQFVLEARTFDAADLKRMKPSKRYALAAMMFHVQLRRAMDNAVTILTRKMATLHNNAKQRLENYHLQRTKAVDTLIEQFRKMLHAFNDGESDAERVGGINKVLTDSPENLMAECDQHMTYAGDNYIPFMLSSFQAQRPLLLNCLELLNIQSSSSDQSLVEACHFVKDHRHSRKAILPLSEGLSLHWLPEKWKKMVISKSSATVEITELNRKYFEICVLSQVVTELKTGDLFVEHSDEYNDYRDQLITWPEYEEQISDYCTLLEIPQDPNGFVETLQSELANMATAVDQQFPENEYVDIDDNGLIIHKHEKTAEPISLKKLDQAITERLPEQNILDVMIEAESWLSLHKKFGPVTGFDTKLKEPQKRFIATLFCYGCNLGPEQTARSIEELSRKQVAWMNLHHITEERLDKAIQAVINAYNKFRLPKSWGSGKHVSADGTKWNLYEQNLLSEYHIRYGGYGGIGYYHVSDMYIALFSHFISCGVYEAIYILDGLIKNESDIQPNTVHGDTQAQSTPVFGLAHLLGINLMPRIRKPKKLIFYRPQRGINYKHIDRLFGEAINWSLIKTHLPDMLRIALSIKSGEITPSTILRRLGTKSRKNKLYFAFRELGRAIRTRFLLKYIGDIELRRTVQTATNKSEEFNQFAQWLLFGGEGVIAENIQHEQRKIIKYNHLVANLVILHNVNNMTRVLNELKKEGFDITTELVAGLAPYRTYHLNRFGDYSLHLGRQIEPMNFQTTFL